MPVLDFPTAPTVSQVYTSGLQSWMWDGITWNIIATVGGGGATIAVGPDAPVGPADGALWWDNDDVAPILNNVNPGVLAADPAFTSAFMPRTSGAGAPAGTGVAGAWYYDTTNKRIYVSDGVGWIIMSEPLQAFTPTWTNVTLGTGGASSGNYHRSDGYIDFYAQAQLGTGGLVTGLISLSTPVALGYHPRFTWNVFFRDATVNDELATHEAVGAGATSITLLGLTLNTNRLGPLNTSATAPFTWAINDNIQINGRARMNTKYL